MILGPCLKLHDGHHLKSIVDLEGIANHVYSYNGLQKCPNVHKCYFHMTMEVKWIYKMECGKFIEMVCVIYYIFIMIPTKSKHSMSREKTKAYQYT